MTWIQSLAKKLPYALGVAMKKKKKKTCFKKKKTCSYLVELRHFKVEENETWSH